MSVSGSDLLGLTFLIGNLLNTDFHQCLLSFRNVPGISMSLFGVTCLEDFAAEMEEVCIQLHLAEGAGRKSRSQGLPALSVGSWVGGVFRCFQGFLVSI